MNIDCQVDFSHRDRMDIAYIATSPTLSRKPILRVVRRAFTVRLGDNNDDEKCADGARH